MRIADVLLAASGLWLAGQAGAAACPAQGSIYQDSFKDQSGGWESGASQMTFGASGLQLQLPPKYLFQSVLNATFFASDGDYCVDATFPKQIANNAESGLIVQAIDYDNYYLFYVTSDGKAMFSRKLAGNWMTVFSTPSPIVKTGPSATNELRAVVKGPALTFYLNGQKIAALRAQPQQNPNLRFGFYAQVDTAIPTAEGRTFSFTDYAVNAAP